MPKITLDKLKRYRIIGEGESAVRDFMKKCREAGGFVQVRRRYGPYEFDKFVYLVCIGAAGDVPGGVVKGVSPKKALEIRSEFYKGTMASRITKEETEEE